MSYPILIAPLHFQYKTAFDILKTYFPIKNDDELSTMVLDFKSNKESKISTKKDVKPKVSKATKDSHESTKETTIPIMDSTGPIMDSVKDSAQKDSTKKVSKKINKKDSL